MNFDKLRETWVGETVPEIRLPAVDAEKTGEAIGKIRRNMRVELILTLTGYVCILIWAVLFPVRGVAFPIVCAASFLFIQNVYYLSRFFVFYRKTLPYDIALTKYVRRYVWELEINIEIYRTYSYCVAGFFCLVWIVLTHAASWGFLVLAIVAQVTIAFMLRMHVLAKYGGYLRELKKVVTDLDED